MAVRLKLKATLVRQLGTEELTDTLTAESFQRTLMVGADDDDGDGDGEVAHGSEDALPVVGDVVDDTYRLVSRLGEGMFGRVYVAERTDVPEHRVALKVINRVIYAGRNVERELVMLAAATHPNIVELKDHGMTDEYVWLTMPLYDGETLAERLERGTLELREAYEIFLPIARGVQALHARNLRHQDIKPENIYLANFAGQPHPVLLDLGVAVEKNADFVAGTALYGAPEQIEALGGVARDGDLSEKVDTYCLATTLLYALVGEENFPGSTARTPFDIVTAFEEREDAPLREDVLPELVGGARTKLSNAMSRWMVRDPEERPSSGELAAELDVLLEKEREEKRAVVRAAARQKNIVRLALGGALAIVVGAAIRQYSQQKELQQAREMEEMAQSVTKTFKDKEECETNYNAKGTQLLSCNAHRKRETAEFKETVLALQSDSSKESSTLVDRLTDTRGKLLSCEEDIEKGTEEREALQSKLTEQGDQFETEKKKLEEARTKAETASETCDTNFETLTQTANTCQQQLLSCRSGAAPPDPDSPYEE
jgi:serine/threonine protein kinase